MPGESADNPIKFSAILSNGRVIPGDTIVMLPGNYVANEKGTISGSDIAGKGVYQFKLNGTSVDPIIFKPQQKNTVRINGGVELIKPSCSNIIIEDIEIAPTPTTRSFDAIASTDFPITAYVNADGCKIRRCFLHDGQQVGIYGSENFELENNIIGYNGCYTSDLNRNRNYGIYTHNATPGIIKIKNNVFLPSFGQWGIALWSAGINDVKNYQANGNVLINCGVIISSDDSLTDNNQFNDNIVACVDSNLKELLALIGIYADDARQLEMLRNYFVWSNGSVRIENFKSINFQNNVVALLDASPHSFGIQYIDKADSENVINNNSYYAEDASKLYNGFFQHNTDYIDTIAAWRTETGFDADSSYVNNSLPADSVVIKEFGEGRWVVAVFNWTSQNNVSVDMSAYVSSLCVVKNVLDYKNDTFEWNGIGNLTLDMVNRGYALPTAYDSPLDYAASPYPRFGCFIVELV